MREGIHSRELTVENFEGKEGVAWAKYFGSGFPRCNPYGSWRNTYLCIAAGDGEKLGNVLTYFTSWILDGKLKLAVSHWKAVFKNNR